MDSAIREVLRAIINERGRDIASDPRRIQAILRDLSGQNRLEITVLVTAMHEGVVAELATEVDRPYGLMIPRLMRRMQDNAGLAEGPARWAVETWAYALGFGFEESSPIRASASLGSNSADSRPTRSPVAAPEAAVLPMRVAETIIDAGRTAAPNAACGLVMGTAPYHKGGIGTSIHICRNTAMSPYRFAVDGRDLLVAVLEAEDRDEMFWAIFTTDPSGSWSRPSATDIRMHFYPDALRIIATIGASPVLSAWAIQEGAATVVPLEIVAE